MSATYRARGDRIDYTPDAAVSAGDVVVQGSLVGIATELIEAGRKGSLAVAGVFDFDKEETAFTVGEDVYFDTDSELAMNDDTGEGIYLGKCVEAAASTAATVRVKLVCSPADSSGAATGTGTGVA